VEIAMTTPGRIEEVARRFIYLRLDGAIVWESILDAYIGCENRKRILILVEDNIVGDAIDWAGVWKDYKESHGNK
jgi:hypothetical protein